MATFIQFYEIGRELMLRNSFSTVWKVIKNLGDILWVDPNKDIFPDVESPVYISCSFEHEIEFLKKWIERKPEVEFIVGGPAVIYMKFFNSYKNVKIDERQMYDLLGVKPTEEIWGLDLPFKNYDKNIFYIYSLSFGNKCYWGKCTFCKTEKAKHLDFDSSEIPILSPYKNRIWLNKQAIEPKDITKFFPKLINNSVYSYYLRGDSGVAKSLKNVPILETHRPIIGVEFPSDRVLKSMNKGLTVQDLLDTILLFLHNGCFIVLTMIHGWNNLTTEDLDNVEYFLNKIEKFKNRIFCVDHLLFFHGRSEEKDTIQCSTKYNKLYYIYDLDENQKFLNDRVMSMYKSFGFIEYSDNSKIKLQGIEYYKQKLEENCNFYE